MTGAPQHKEFGAAAPGFLDPLAPEQAATLARHTGPHAFGGRLGIGFWVTLGEWSLLALERAQRLFECLTESFVLCQRLVQTALGSISVLPQELDFLFDFLNSAWSPPSGGFHP